MQRYQYYLDVHAYLILSLTSKEKWLRLQVAMFTTSVMSSLQLRYLSKQSTLYLPDLINRR